VSVKPGVMVSVAVPTHVTFCSAAWPGGPKSDARTVAAAATMPLAGLTFAGGRLMARFSGASVLDMVGPPVRLII
jgi:hypothetical protein